MFCLYNYKLVLVLVALFASTVLAQSCQVSVQQTIASAWNDGGAYSMVNVEITNTGSSVVSSVLLQTSSQFQSLWEMTNTNGQLVFPDWRAQQGLAVGESHSWGYIIKSTSTADLTVASVACAGGAESAPTTPEESDTISEESESDGMIAKDDSDETPASECRAQDPEPTEAATHKPTQAPTHKPTQKPTKAPTQKPTKAPTQKPTKAPTQKPTKAPTQKPTTRPTQAPTTKPTKAPTSKPTQAPTTKPTTGTTTKMTTPSTPAPTIPPAGANGRVCPAGQVWSPTPGTTWEWQLQGTIDMSYNVQMYDIDMFDNDASVIQTLHNQGRVVICYFSTQYENWRPDASEFTAAVLGNNLDDWPGEKYVDIRSDVVRNIMSARLDLALSKGCDGVEPDNVDGYTNNNGFDLTAADQISFNTFIAEQAHSRGLSVGLKNDLDQVTQLQTYFDWALDEQCNQYSECSSLNPFHSAGKAVFGVEYQGSPATFCPKMVADGFSWLLKDLDLDGTVGAQCCTYASGGCVSAPYTCKTPTTTAKRAEIAEEPSQVVEETQAVEEVEDYSSSARSVAVSFAFVAPFAALAMLL